MIYAMSDLHGCYNLYVKMLEKINFSDEDTLYLLGDYVDRGDNGFGIILDIARRKNVVALMGNHDFYALSVLSAMCLNPNAKSDPRVRSKYETWIYNGGATTYEQFWTFNQMKQVHILSAMDGFKNYADITVGGRRFTMVHGGIAGYDPNRPLDDYGIGELAFGREDYGQPKFNEEGRFLVTGHTPTALIDPNFRGKIFHGHDHIGLDCGAVFGLGLGCLCLDTLEEFYVI